MPGGKVHSALTVATLSGVIAPYALVQLNGNPWLYAAGCITGLLITPDLDINNGNISDTFIRKVSPVVQMIWRLFWTPYALILPHRSLFSHFPFVGTLLRLGYIFVWLNLFNLLFFLVGRTFDTVSLVWVWNWSFFFGLCHADIIHWFADNTIKGKEQFENE